MHFHLHTLDQLKPIIQGFRKRSGLTQAAMASKLGVTQQSYAQIESNPHTTSFERLYTILRLLGVEISFSNVAVPDDETVPALEQPGVRGKLKAPDAVKQKDETEW